MSSESVCQVTRSWVDVGSFHARLLVRFMIFTALVRTILDTPSYLYCVSCYCLYVRNVVYSFDLFITRFVANIYRCSARILFGKLQNSKQTSRPHPVSRWRCVITRRPLYHRSKARVVNCIRAWPGPRNLCERPRQRPAMYV
jgi:hypothetical protein